MVIIITGPSLVGKTSLAQRMLEKYKYPYLSIDHLKMGLIRSHKTELTPYDDDKLTDYLWPITLEIIKTAIENKQNLIVEGCYVPANWKTSFTNKYLTDIRFICIAFSSNYIDSNFDLIIRHRSNIEKRIIDSDYTIEKLKKENYRYYNDFKNDGVYLIESDYIKTIESII